MRCSLGEPAGKTQRRGRRFAMARETRAPWEPFSRLRRAGRETAFLKLRRALWREHGQRERVFPGVVPHSSRRMAFRPHRVQRAAGWACPAGRNSRRSTSIRHPRKEVPSPCPAALARRKGKCRTAAPPPAPRRRGPCGEIPHNRPRAARPPWETARAGLRKPPIRQSGPVRGRFWGGADKTSRAAGVRPPILRSPSPSHPRPSAASVARETASFSAMRACRRS